MSFTLQRKLICIITKKIESLREINCEIQLTSEFISIVIYALPDIEPKFCACAWIINRTSVKWKKIISSSLICIMASKMLFLALSFYSLTRYVYCMQIRLVMWMTTRNRGCKMSLPLGSPAGLRPCPGIRPWGRASCCNLVSYNVR